MRQTYIQLLLTQTGRRLEIVNGYNDSIFNEGVLTENLSAETNNLTTNEDSLIKNKYIFSGAENDKDDLMTDFASVITSFCSRLYGLRRAKRKTEKIIAELESSNGDENDSIFIEEPFYQQSLAEANKLTTREGFLNKNKEHLEDE